MNTNMAIKSCHISGISLWLFYAVYGVLFACVMVVGAASRPKGRANCERTNVTTRKGHAHEYNTDNI